MIASISGGMLGLMLRGIRLARQVRDQHFTEAIAGEGTRPVKLEHHDAEGVDVGAGVDLAFAIALLGAHIGRRADDHAGARLLRQRRARSHWSAWQNAEVEQLDVVAIAGAIAQKDVLGLEVAMDDALEWLAASALAHCIKTVIDCGS